MKQPVFLLSLLILGLGCRGNNGNSANHNTDALLASSLSVDSLYNLAMQAYEGEDYTKAIQYFDALLLQDSLVSDALHDRGLCYYMLENYTQAERDVRSSMRLDSTYAPGWLQWGMI
ncbi:MAG: tetratricopeptide repeat protein, partial [Flavobacteriales bacterium]